MQGEAVVLTWQLRATLGWVARSTRSRGQMKRMMRMRRGMRQSMAERVEDLSLLRKRKTFDQDKCLEHATRRKVMLSMTNIRGS